MRSQASSSVERYADNKTHCLDEIGQANVGVTTPIPLWVRNNGRPVDVPWFRWALSNRVPSSCPFRRIPRQDPLHTTGWESLINGWYTIIPKDKVKAESLLITEHSSHTSMCINNASLFLAYQSINGWQNRESSYFIEIEWWQSFHYIYQLHCIWQSLVFEVITYSLCNTWFVLW